MNLPRPMKICHFASEGPTAQGDEIPFSSSQNQEILTPEFKPQWVFFVKACTLLTICCWQYLVEDSCVPIAPDIKETDWFQLAWDCPAFKTTVLPFSTSLSPEQTVVDGHPAGFPSSHRKGRNLTELYHCPRMAAEGWGTFPTELRDA